MVAGRLLPSRTRNGGLAGRFAVQTGKAEMIGSMPCDTPTFGALVLGSVVLLVRCASCPPASGR